MAAELAAEAHLPRWRRQSLNEARRADPKALAAAPAMTFHGAAQSETERAVIRYDLVRMTDVPDEISGAVVAELLSGDEIEIVERRGVWLYVRTPFGAEGWIHRTTIGRTTQPESVATGGTADPAGAQDAPMLESLLAGIAARRNGQASGDQASSGTPAGDAADAADEPAPPPPPTVIEEAPPAKARDARSRGRRQSSPQTTG
jgi:hypothetical protein